MGTRRKAMVAAAISLFGAAAVVPMVVSGPASAEEGFRICGVRIPGSGEGELGSKPTFLIYKVFKGDESACDAARETAEGEEPIGPETCESMTSTMAQALGGKITRFKEDGTDKPIKNENDFCFNMKPSSVTLEGSSGVNAFGYTVRDRNLAEGEEWLDVAAIAQKPIRWEIRDSTPPFDPPCC